MLDGDSSVDMVYLDFSKAFDKVDHGILLHKLRALGITGNIGIWLFHFLTDRSHKAVTMFVPQKQSKKSKVSRFHHERKIIMRKRLKLVKSSKPTPLIKSHLVMLEKQLCDSHLDEKRFEENAAVSKIKDDPNYFFRYAMKFSIGKTDIYGIS